MRYILFLFLICLFTGRLSAQKLNIGKDTSICPNDSILIKSNIIDSTYQYKWKNGDTSDSSKIDTSDLAMGFYWLEMKKDTLKEVFDSILMEFKMIVDTIYLRDTIKITIKNKPVCNFNSTPSCFGLPISINNLSDTESGSDVYYYFGNEPPFIDNSSVYNYNGLDNGKELKLKNIIKQPNGCMDTSEITINCLLTPSAILESDSTCANEDVIIKNLSINTTNLYTLTLKNNQYSFSPSPPSNTINLNRLLPGLQKFEVVLSNDNGCKDTIDHSIYIFPIEPREISGLPSQFCADYEPIMISGNFNGGFFTGINIKDFGNGTALYTPRDTGTMLNVIYTYKDQNNCTESTTQTTRVDSIPIVDFNTLETAYCHKSTKSTIEGSHNGGVFAEMWANGGASNALLTNSTGKSVDFTPNEVGDFIIRYYFKDSHGCDDEISKATKVNPLPIVDLSGNPTKFESALGETLSNKILYGPEVSYLWSTGANTPTIEVFAPGYYDLKIKFLLTGCEDKDSINIELLENTQDLGIEKVLVYPNPFQYEIRISFENPHALKNQDFDFFDEAGRKIPFEITIKPYDVILSPKSQEKGMHYLKIKNRIVSVIRN